jgi:hypothetical protein
MPSRPGRTPDTTESFLQAALAGETAAHSYTQKTQKNSIKNKKNINTTKNIKKNKK